jgi:hypothetical protein
MPRGTLAVNTLRFVAKLEHAPPYERLMEISWTSHGFQPIFNFAQ